MSYIFKVSSGVEEFCHGLQVSRMSCEEENKHNVIPKNLFISSPGFCNTRGKLLHDQGGFVRSRTNATGRSGSSRGTLQPVMYRPLTTADWTG